MIINTFSYLWTLTAVDAISELVRCGYRVFEVPVSSPHCWPDEMSPTMRSDAKKRLQDYSARIRSLNAGGYDINLASPGANMRRKSIDHIRDVMDLAFDWGAHARWVKRAHPLPFANYFGCTAPISRCRKPSMALLSIHRTTATRSCSGST